MRSSSEGIGMKGSKSGGDYLAGRDGVCRAPQEKSPNKMWGRLLNLQARGRKIGNKRENAVYEKWRGMKSEPKGI